MEEIKKQGQGLNLTKLNLDYDGQKDGEEQAQNYLNIVNEKIGFIPITPSLPYPVKLELINVIIVFITILVLGGFASKIAATRVSEKLIS